MLNLAWREDSRNSFFIHISSWTRFCFCSSMSRNVIALQIWAERSLLYWRLVRERCKDLKDLKNRVQCRRRNDEESRKTSDSSWRISQVIQQTGKILPHQFAPGRSFILRAQYTLQNNCQKFISTPVLTSVILRVTLFSTFRTSAPHAFRFSRSLLLSHGFVLLPPNYRAGGWTHPWAPRLSQTRQ